MLAVHTLYSRHLGSIKKSTLDYSSWSGAKGAERGERGEGREGEPCGAVQDAQQSDKKHSLHSPAPPSPPLLALLTYYCTRTTIPIGPDPPAFAYFKLRRARVKPRLAPLAQLSAGPSTGGCTIAPLSCCLLACIGAGATGTASK